jgi:hypothetical protein
MDKIEKSNKKEINITVALDPKDFLRFNRLFALKKMIITNTILLSLIISGIVIFNAINTGNLKLFGPILLYICIIIVINIPLAFVIAFFRININSANAFKRDIRLSDVQKYTLTERGIVGSSSHEDVKYKWDQISKIKESKHIIALFVEANTACVFPKRFIGNDSEIESFKKYVEKYSRKVFR